MTPARSATEAADAPARQPYVSATVVQAERPTSARPGDSAVVHPDGRIEGFVGGVCAESTVRMHALQAMASGEAMLLRIIPGDGEVPTDGEGVVSVHNPCLSGGALQIFLQPHLPPRRMTVYGTAPIARDVAELSRHLGYEVTEAEGADEDLPADTSAVVIASLGRFDEQALLKAVAAGVPYIGLVASPKRGGAVVSGLGLSPDDLARVHTPAGLDIGARAPREIALSILAEVISLRGSTPAGVSYEHEAGHSMAIDMTAEALDGPPAASAIDPICGMTVAAVEATLHVEHGGVVTWFCGEACVRAFEADPARHLDAGGRDPGRPGGVRERARA